MKICARRSAPESTSSTSIRSCGWRGGGAWRKASAKYTMRSFRISSCRSRCAPMCGDKPHRLLFWTKTQPICAIRGNDAFDQACVTHRFLARRSSRNRMRHHNYRTPQIAESDGEIAADLLVVEHMRLLGRLAHLFDRDRVEIGEKGFAPPGSAGAV